MFAYSVIDFLTSSLCLPVVLRKTLRGLSEESIIPIDAAAVEEASDLHPLDGQGPSRESSTRW